MKKKLRNIVWTIVYLTTISLFILTVLEIVYRNQCFDFFYVELNTLNTSNELQCGEKKILVFGDSFGAQKNSYVQLLKDSLYNYAVINCSVPGTSMREMSYMAKRRIDQFSPEKIILQYYVGNDLIDILHPYNTESISWLRNIYWLLADRFSVLAWVNYKLGALRTQFDEEQKFVVPSNTEAFSYANYNGRVKLLIRADKYFISKSILLNDKQYNKAFEQLINYSISIENYFKHRNPSGEVILLVIPHCTQIDKRYQLNYENMGAAFENMTNIGEDNFYRGISSRFRSSKFVNPIDSFQLSERIGKQVYFQNDDHLNNSGQTIVGQILLHIIR
ncbi:MAG: hypothetical protein U0T74_01320 [Chitinophagales bacterium]